jgi:hypothetical protein
MVTRSHRGCRVVMLKRHCQYRQATMLVSSIFVEAFLRDLGAEDLGG